MTRPEPAQDHVALPGALHSSPDALAVYSKTPQGEELLTLTKNVTAIYEDGGGSIRIFGEHGVFKAALYDHKNTPDPRVIDLAKLAREAADRQGITIYRYDQEDQS